ncbi:methyltransferase family protein [Mumia flava]|uniref:Methyltransferase family protein n=2 Tax=Mumia flava TaxID=1348852 RepID=A0A0B2B8A3_9ACTN|nr:methyltransferase family protein [Mumia flava]
MSGVPWDASYTQGPAPWDLGRPQPAIVRLAEAGAFCGPVLDAGCGTGENALHVASLGVEVLGVDVAPTAIAEARTKAAARGSGAQGATARFEVGDAFDLAVLGRRFATVLDCGMFHTCDADERPRYVASLAVATERGGTLHVLCLGDEGEDVGPHPVSRGELRAAFAPATGWEVVRIVEERIETRFHGPDGAPGWLATVRRL